MLPRILVLVAVLMMALAPPVFAQAPPAPAPKVTISGFIDQVTSWTSNKSVTDLNFKWDGDREWYARTRVRPDIIAELGTTRMVLGLELDTVWGQTGNTDVTGPLRNGASAGADLNTDIIPIIELKWAYTQFRMPLIPWPTQVRLGLQPHAVMYKSGVYSSGDFAGADFKTTITPNFKFNLAYVQSEEASTGYRDGFPRGEDYAITTSVEITPFKGLDIQPIYSLFVADGSTSIASRQPRGGLGIGGVTAPNIFGPGAAVIYPPGFTEIRHTMGIDARWTFGPFYLDPTILYQTGSREVNPSAQPSLAGFPVNRNPYAGLNPGRKEEQGLDAWLIDVRGGWRSGPLLVEGAFIFSTGNSAKDDIRNGRKTVKYFEPLSTDAGFFSTWAAIWAHDLDYFAQMYTGARGLRTGVGIGFDKYGLIRLGLRASYDVTPALTFRAMASQHWTEAAVDPSSVLTAATGLIPGNKRGKSQNLGTEGNIGVTYRFAPGVAFDLMGSYMWSGPALSQHAVVGTTSFANGSVPANARDPEDVAEVASRIRFSF